MNAHFVTVLVVSSITCWGQVPIMEFVDSKKFMDQVEIFGGPNSSFNHGNKFLENYSDQNISNKRLAKLGLSVGIGAYHSFSSYLSLNVRLLYVQKGRKTELNSPLIPDDRRIGLKNYTYDYLALSLAPQVYIGRRREIFLSAGAYYSKIQKMRGFEKITNTRGQVFFEDKFRGRFFEDLDDTGSVYSITWTPGIQSFNTHDVGAVMSVGYNFCLEKSQLIAVQIVHNFGLTNINKESPYGQKERNRSVDLVLSYTWLRKTLMNRQIN